MNQDSTKGDDSGGEKPARTKLRASIERDAKEVAEFAHYLKATPPSEGSSGVFYPGEVEHLREAERRKSGIDVEESTWEKLRAIAGEHGLAAGLGLK